MLIYTAEDDKNIGNLLVTHLQNNGYTVKGFSNGQELLDEFKITPCDLIITDIMMPVMGGYELCKQIRTISMVPIIMISANNDEIDRVLGLELGADDYIGKPISFRELCIKVKNLLMRAKFTAEKDNKEVARHKDLSMDFDAHVVKIGEKVLTVTPKEFDLLKLFITHKNRAFSREQIINSVWEYDYDGDARQVDHVIKRLRKKMLEHNAECQIQTVWGIGYKIGGEDEK
ncbi:MAG: hypothetical protein ATN35_08125 [Epulopiscium sp. Nele67-Bin004]|nr:MAG: hypothetical protein ATN35_08125 [Epulopiscium sp. Nele67-Bin004]